MRKHFDVWSLLSIAVTLVLFAASLFATGFRHALFLEAGVFLVSVKLILMAYKLSVSNEGILRGLGEIQAAIRRLEGAGVPGSTSAAAAKPSDDCPRVQLTDQPAG
jgi:hypothetical protein